MKGKQIQHKNKVQVGFSLRQKRQELPYRILLKLKCNALQPGEGTAGIDVEEVGLLLLPNAHGNVDVAVEK